MSKRLFLFTSAFISVYLLLILIRQMPLLLHGRFGLLSDAHSFKEWLQVTGDIACLYLLSIGVYMTLHCFYPLKQIYILILVTLILAAGIFCVTFYWTGFMENRSLRLSNHFGRQVIPETIAILFAIVFYLVRYTQYKELQQIELTSQNRKAEISFLRSQINPHFLFNNLNTIYSLVAHQSERALPAIAELSEILRYMLYDSSESISLAEELLYIKKYIALQQLRFEHPMPICFNVTGNTGNWQTPPLLFIPFVENAFKHGEVMKDSEWLKIDMNTESDLLTFSCINKTKAGIRKDSTGGIGIINVRKRRELLYPNGRSLLDVREENNLFTVRMELYGK